ncbi:MAG: hypothetical protein OEU26_22625 [Candidatus Tectomicrobia bacterium]|nr:hypothetical protein [Candidatus Tectomicrobia bacterium]
MLQYVQGRNTKDINLILSTSSLQKLPEITITSQDDDFARGTFETLQIDFLRTRNPLFARVQRGYIDSDPVSCLGKIALDNSFFSVAVKNHRNRPAVGHIAMFMLL